MELVTKERTPKSDGYCVLAYKAPHHWVSDDICGPPPPGAELIGILDDRHPSGRSAIAAAQATNAGFLMRSSRISGVWCWHAKNDDVPTGLPYVEWVDE